MNKNFERRNRPRGTQGIKGYFLCKRDHRDNENHSKGEVPSAINILKEKQPEVFLSQYDHGCFEAMFAGNSDGDENHLDDAQVDDSEGLRIGLTTKQRTLGKKLISPMLPMTN